MKRTDQQVPTVPISIQEIMSAPLFERGVNDARAGRGYPGDYDLWAHTNDRWAYERGRQWALLVPRHVPLRRNGRISNQAIALFCEHDADIL